MKCQEAAALLAALADGELDAVQSDVVERHLMNCAACAAELQALRQLRSRLREETRYFRAPQSLRIGVAARLALSATPTASPGTRESARSRPARRWHWLGLGAAAGSVATAGALMLASAVIDWQSANDLVHQAVAAHVRATLSDRLVEVASSDQHTVKPWLSSRLDYAPPVREAPQEGFTLIGGRLDHVQRASVATLVYRYRQHTIDVFVRPLSRQSTAPVSTAVRGFNVVQAAGSGMEWTAVSDLNAAQLSAFVQNLAGPPP